MMTMNQNITIILKSLCSPLLIHSYIILFSLITTTTFSFVDYHYEACKPQTCGNSLNISYPFYIQGKQQPFCGYPGFGITCSRDGHPLLNLSNTPYIIDQIFYENASLRVSNAVLSRWGTDSTRCLSLTQNLTLPPSNKFRLGQNQKDIILFFDCDLSLLPRGMEQHSIGCSAGNERNSVLALYKKDKDLNLVNNSCRGEVVDAVVVDDGSGGNIGEALRRGFLLNWTASDCNLCRSSGGRCGFNFTIYNFRCFCTDRPHASNCQEKKGRFKLGLGLGIGILSILLICLVLLFLLYKRRRASSASDFQSRNSFSESSLNPRLESGGAYFGVPLFSYKELKEATNNFDHTKELGDGGFGTVYYGKLQDGREVAVKRLYEHNYRRVEQFMNEVQILTRLRHKNLVSLYGCTSRHSRELLLVYEYIPNGTVASHIHGELAKPGLPPWSTRIKIAVETATALAYLHACDIIHRDVKTNNILLDSNFTVKVADFGLSRLFPIDATHVSTAPQGTPGYVDPEYHQNYQLTSKSDVYSFGVMLIELISSKPAVDMNRDRDEINLSNLAIKKIQESAISELVDPSLGFDSDNEVMRMIVSVAELAFQCLQRDKELRPSMDEVLDELKKIESGNAGQDLQEEVDVHGSAGVSHSNSVRPPPPPSPDQWDEVGLLKNVKFPTSPNTVTDKWESKCTTPNASA